MSPVITTRDRLRRAPRWVIRDLQPAGLGDRDADNHVSVAGKVGHSQKSDLARRRGCAHADRPRTRRAPRDVAGPMQIRPAGHADQTMRSRIDSAFAASSGMVCPTIKVARYTVCTSTPT